MPSGQMALATPGAACKPAKSALAAVPAKPEISGPAINERPAVSAVRRSFSTTLVVCLGSISVIKGWLRSKPESVA